MWSIGPDHDPGTFFLTMTMKAGSPCGAIVFETSCELKKNQMSTTYVPNLIPPAPFNPQNTNQSDVNDSLTKLLEIFDKAVGVKKESGVWVPKFNPGDTLIVDKAGASEVKVLDPEEQAFERVPKKALTVQADACSSPMRQLITVGCPKLKGEAKCAE